MMFSFVRLQKQAQITAILELVEGSVLLARIDSADSVNFVAQLTRTLRQLA
jgi:hypothetical protein